LQNVFLVFFSQTCAAFVLFFLQRPSEKSKISQDEQPPQNPAFTKKQQEARASPKGPPKKNKEQKSNPKKQPTGFPFFFFFFRRPLRRLWVVCGHATACGHPQLAVGSSFTS
jgi:hypothetical protein